jgi:quinol monooxygenase YgiN
VRFEQSARNLETAMIKELAEIDIKPGEERAFEEAAVGARDLFLGSKGCLTFRLHRSMEQPSRYRLVVEWETIEDHMVEFRNSEAFVAWRRLCGPFFLCPPRVEHLVVVVEGYHDNRHMAQSPAG